MKIKVLNNQVQLPKVYSELAAGVDLEITNFKMLFKGSKAVEMDKFKHSINNGYITLRGFERVLCGTNLFIEIPQGYYLAIVDRSGNALKRGLFVANSPGTIDAGSIM
jgi:dUTPase